MGLIIENNAIVISNMELSIETLYLNCIKLNSNKIIKHSTSYIINAGIHLKESSKLICLNSNIEVTGNSITIDNDCVLIFGTYDDNRAKNGCSLIANNITTNSLFNSLISDMSKNVFIYDTYIKTNTNVNVDNIIFKDSYISGKAAKQVMNISASDSNILIDTSIITSMQQAILAEIKLSNKYNRTILLAMGDSMKETPTEFTDIKGNKLIL